SEEEITVHVINTITNCHNEGTFKLMVNPLPVANVLSGLICCDDDDDGISECFDTSNLELEVLGSQMNMEVSYFVINGDPLPNPLPNPYTSSIVNEQIIKVRVTNPLTYCYDETPLVLKTASQPQIKTPRTLYGCDMGDGTVS